MIPASRTALAWACLLLAACSASGRSSAGGADPLLLEQKVQNPAQIKEQLALAERRGATLPCFLRLRRTEAPPDEPAIRRALAAAGFAAETIAGDVATGQLQPGALNRVLAISWVTYLEPSAPVRVR